MNSLGLATRNPRYVKLMIKCLNENVEFLETTQARSSIELQFVGNKS